MHDAPLAPAWFQFHLNSAQFKILRVGGFCSAAAEAKKAQEDRFERQIAAAKAREAESEKMRQMALGESLF